MKYSISSKFNVNITFHILSTYFCYLHVVDKETKSYELFSFHHKQYLQIIFHYACGNVTWNYNKLDTIIIRAKFVMFMM